MIWYTYSRTHTPGQIYLVKYWPYGWFNEAKNGGLCLLRSQFEYKPWLSISLTCVLRCLYSRNAARLVNVIDFPTIPDTPTWQRPKHIRTSGRHPPMDIHTKLTTGPIYLVSPRQTTIQVIFFMCCTIYPPYSHPQSGWSMLSSVVLCATIYKLRRHIEFWCLRKSNQQ